MIEIPKNLGVHHGAHHGVHLDHHRVHRRVHLIHRGVHPIQKNGQLNRPKTQLPKVMKLQQRHPRRRQMLLMSKTTIPQQFQQQNF